MTAGQIDGDTYAGFNKIGIQGGMFVNTLLYRNLGVQFELKYAGKGAQKVTSTDNILTYKIALHYIDLPVMLTYTIKEHLIIDLGLVPGYLFARHGEKDGYVYEDEDFEKFRKIDIAWLTGVNYKITKNFIVNVRYSYSVRPIRKLEVVDTSYGLIGRTLGYTRGLYNNYLTFGIYFQFN
jgi:opacity protein-like surface antigen